MIKKVSVEDLRPGVFIHDFGRKWMKHPFLTKTRLIENEWDIERIRKYDITEVYIDTARGLNVKSKSISLEEWNKAFGSNEELRKKLALERSPWVPFEKELEKAKEIKNKARVFIEELTNNVIMGKNFDIKVAEDIVDDMLSSLARNRDALLSLISLQNKDEYTFNHSINVSVMMASFCKYLGMDAEKIKIYATGALFHDLGKTQIPIEIISKPSGYSDEEFKIMKQHPQFGKDILTKMDNVESEMIEVVFEHHERMDGSGYPNGLTGRQISLGGRLASIVDVYDALTSDRPYKEGDSPTDVLKYLFESSPSGFDLELLQKFIHSIGIYPIGSLVRLKSGFLAIVVESAKDNMLKPTVLLVYDINKKRKIPTRKLDLSAGVGGLHQISGTESPSQWDIDIAESMKIN